jgi:hypothetical protein
MEARQACAEGREDRVREILKLYTEQGINANTGNPAWLIYKMLGEEEEAEAVLRHFEFDEVPYAIAAWLTYPSFDPRPFPELMAVLERENVQRRPPASLPYACSQT